MQHYCMRQVGHTAKQLPEPSPTHGHRSKSRAPTHAIVNAAMHPHTITNGTLCQHADVCDNEVSKDMTCILYIAEASM